MKNNKVLKELVGTSLNGSEYSVQSNGNIKQSNHNTSFVSIKDLFKVRIKFFKIIIIKFSFFLFIIRMFFFQKIIQNLFQMIMFHIKFGIHFK